MPKSNVETIGFKKENYPKVIDVANELADLENRKPHDSISNLILEVGRTKIAKIRSERAKELGIPAVEPPSSVEGTEHNTQSLPESQ